ncbi:Unknown protein sequence [Pseudomonas syringae pv. syringae]|uniref:Uncharacterized protein n=1 Tax=Pseudomonas syringae pv. apii TaxID=81036 RepID=A0A3M5WE93_9PSED|nr:Unknown protein sequence [Pseudomonas syringae pv. syringae]RMR46649.1 hypothetical protein ALP85_102620 [Pseudomonas syringae pv. syringae]RMU68134.1 hypothetical protein ALP23_102549 [Pseudomonas syringae pv. apii]
MTHAPARLPLLKLFAIIHNYRWKSGIQNSWKSVAKTP